MGALIFSYCANSGSDFVCDLSEAGYIALPEFGSSLRSFKHPRPLSHRLYLAMAAVVGYTPPWWVNLLHRLPHFNLQFEQTSSDFRPEDWTYQQVNKRFVISSVWLTMRSSSPLFFQLIGEITSMHQVCRTAFEISALITFSPSSWWRLIRLHLFPLLYLLIRVTICAWLSVVPCLDLWHTTQPAGTKNRFVHMVESKEISICRSANLPFLPAAINLLHF